MGRAVSIPVKIIRKTEPQSLGPAPDADARATRDGQVEGTKTLSSTEAEAGERARREDTVKFEPSLASGKHQPEDVEQWRNRALRLQAEMDNYRKRQRRLAQDQVEEERLRLLSTFLSVVDDIERALAVEPADASTEEGLRRGVDLTRRSALQILEKEGVERIEADGRPFDPTWHEAVSTLPVNGSGVAPDTVIRVLAPGYRLGGRLLRPARVVVGVQDLA